MEKAADQKNEFGGGSWSIGQFIVSQYMQIAEGGGYVFFKKTKVLFSLMLAVPFLIVVFLLRMFFLVRWHELRSSRIGHFAANTELYCCERDAGINVPDKLYVDLFYFESEVCNQQLAKMWRRELNIMPKYIAFVLVGATRILKKIIFSFPVFGEHLIGDNSNEDRDILNLFDKVPLHLSFTTEEENEGRNWLKNNNIPIDAKIVLLIVRDDAYLSTVYPLGKWDYHSYRDCDVANFVLASEELADRGYYIIRMGCAVNKPICSSHPQVIDYATNGMRCDFMDIYLSSIACFTITTSLGMDAVAGACFRKPSVTVDFCPVVNVISYFRDSLFLLKHHYSMQDNKELSLSEIFTSGVDRCFETKCYSDKNIKLVENTPDEIRDIAIEMADRLEGVWSSEECDETLKNKFWRVFPVNAVNQKNKPIHGEVHARMGAKFLRENSEWLE